jgi:DNA-binding response OmpR family regulator
VADAFAPGAEVGGLQRILIIDDDPAVCRLVASKLTVAGFEVVTARDGREGLDVIQQRGLPHLAIVDISMPRMDGFEFCESVQQFCDLPVVILTANDQEETIVRGIELYAEDYVTKPFSPRELIARVRRVLRRIGDFAYALEPQIQVDDRLIVDFARQQVFLEGQSVVLSPTETKLLYLLMRNAGRTVTNDFLLRRLWPLKEVFEDTLRVHVYRLRKKLEPGPHSWRYVITDRGVGYRFVSAA